MSNGKNKERKVRGSESAFMWGRLVFTDYDTGCLRKIYLRSRGVRGKVADVHGKRGAQFEETFGKRIAQQHSTVQAELPVVRPIDGQAGFTFSGRMDYLGTDSGDLKKVYELKSTESKNVLRAMKQGTFKTENLAQLVSYMIAVGTDQGELRYAYMEPDASGAYTIKSERAFDVRVNDYGRLIVDGKPNRFTVFDQLAHQQTAAHVIENDIIYDRPANFSAAFGSPCSYCPFKNACDLWDSGSVESVDGFVEISKQCLKE